MKKLKNLFPLLIISFISCGITKSELETPDIEQYFKAEINGNAWVATTPPRGGLVMREGDSTITIGGEREWSENSFFHDLIVFSVIYDESKNNYPVERRQVKEFNAVGMLFIEEDYDVFITSYSPISDSTNFLSLNLSNENDYTIAEGEFSAVFVIEESYINNPYSQENRQYPDTIKVTNGQYRVLIE